MEYGSGSSSVSVGALASSTGVMSEVPAAHCFVKRVPDRAVDVVRGSRRHPAALHLGIKLLYVLGFEADGRDRQVSAAHTSRRLVRAQPSCLTAHGPARGPGLFLARTVKVPLWR
jgi:hypothetical protein